VHQGHEEEEIELLDEISKKKKLKIKTSIKHMYEYPYVQITGISKRFFRAETEREEEDSFSQPTFANPPLFFPKRLVVSWGCYMLCVYI
jgi:hypothetical protein